MSDHEKYTTQDEREPSDCARRTEKGQGKRRTFKGYWKGMNSRDETDTVTMKPIGRMLSEGFYMLRDDEDLRDVTEQIWE